jgi:hypothetical protein
METKGISDKCLVVAIYNEVESMIHLTPISNRNIYEDWRVEMAMKSHFHSEANAECFFRNWFDCVPVEFGQIIQSIKGAKKPTPREIAEAVLITLRMMKKKSPAGVMARYIPAGVEGEALLIVLRMEK